MLKKLISEAEFLIRETAAQFKNPAVLWSTGKDSTVVLDLIRNALGTIPFPVIHIDTGLKFPEIYKFRDAIARKWEFNHQLRVIRALLIPEHTYVPHDHYACCTVHKIDVLKKFMNKHQIDALIVSIRRDEHGIRNKERYMSPRTKKFEWRVVQDKEGGDSGLESLQDVEMSGWSIFASDYGEDCDHVRVHPILSWSEVNIWEYIKERKLPYLKLYRADYMEKKHGVRGIRHRSVGCIPCSQPIRSMASSVDEIIEELYKTTEDERKGRAQDKDKELVMERLRALGYL